MAELVGILNITPDSFSDGSRYQSAEDAVRHTKQLFIDGASVVDVGAESTRPGAVPLSWEEEIARLAPFFREARTRGWDLSLDTYHPETVRWAATQIGRFIINDVTGFRNADMREAAAETGNEVIVSHLPHASADIQSAHKEKPIDSVEQVVEELFESIAALVVAGVAHKNIIADPGIGFGKTLEVNWELLEIGKKIPLFRTMVGYSRKRFLGEERMELPINLFAGEIAVGAGAHYLRVHDVAGHRPLIGL